MVLLVSAGLLGKSFYRLLRVDTGMQVDHLATLTRNAPQDGYSTDEEQAALERQITDRIAMLPGCNRSAPPARRRSSVATRCGSESRAAPITVSTTRCSIER